MVAVIESFAHSCNLSPGFCPGPEPGAKEAAALPRPTAAMHGLRVNPSKSVLFKNQAALTFITSQVRKESDDLHCFAQASLIRQDAVEMLPVELGQPVQTDLLVISERAVQQRRGAHLHLQ